MHNYAASDGWLGRSTAVGDRRSTEDARGGSEAPRRDRVKKLLRLTWLRPPCIWECIGRATSPRRAVGQLLAADDGRQICLLHCSPAPPGVARPSGVACMLSNLLHLCVAAVWWSACALRGRSCVMHHLPASSCVIMINLRKWSVANADSKPYGDIEQISDERSHYRLNYKGTHY